MTLTGKGGSDLFGSSHLKVEDGDARAGLGQTVADRRSDCSGSAGHDGDICVLGHSEASLGRSSAASGSNSVGSVKPPICEVCNSRFDRDGGELVDFVIDAGTEAFDERAERPGFVGHRPNGGWFCNEHLAAARARAGSMTLGDALDDIKSRSGFRTEVLAPVPAPGHARCATCGIEFPERAGSLVSFVEGDAERARRLAQTGDARFEYKNRRWFCPRHHGPALMISSAVGVAEALKILVPEGRAPFEYDEVPPGVEIGAIDEHGEPMRGPVIPMPDRRLVDEVEPRHAEIVPRVATDVARILRDAVASIQQALGVDHLRNAGSTSTRHDEFEDERWPLGAERCSARVSSSNGGDLMVFLISAHHHDVDDIEFAEHARLLVQRREVSLFEVLVVAGPDATITPDGRALLDRIQLRVAPGSEEVFAPVIDELVSAFGTPAFDPFELGPDLDGVDLRGGQITRSGTDRSTIEWPLRPVPVPRVRELFLELVPALFAEFDLGDPPEMERADRRDWSPMDGSVAPNCPYVDHVTHEWRAADNRSLVSVSSDQAHWNDDDISNVSARIFLVFGGADVSAYAAGRGAHDACTTLSLFRPTSKTVIDALLAAFEPWLDAEPMTP